MRAEEGRAWSLPRRPPRRAGRRRCHTPPRSLSAQPAGKPKVNVISQWSSGSSGAAMVAARQGVRTRGRRVGTRSGTRLHHRDMNKLRAQIIAGDPPAASQLKGPEIAVRSNVGAVVDLDDMAAAASATRRWPAELANLQRGRQGPLDCVAGAGLSHQHAVHLEEGRRQGWRHKAPPPPGRSSTRSPRK